MKPVLLKTGIPLALLIAGFIYAKIAARRNSITRESSCEPKSIKEFIGDGDESQVIMESIESFDAQEKHDYGEEILRLSQRIAELQEALSFLEKRFLRYQDLKEQESALMELRHALYIETVHVEYFEEEILLMEDINRKVKKILGKAKERLQTIGEKNLDIEHRDEEILRISEELRMKDGVIMKSNEEIEKLRSIVNHLQEENKINAESVTKEEYNKIVNELEQLKRDRSAEVEEVMKLNAEDIGKNGSQQGERCMDVATSQQARPTKGNLIQKFKRLVDKGEKMKRNRN